jgi:hypothetical protein
MTWLAIAADAAVGLLFAGLALCASSSAFGYRKIGWFERGVALVVGLTLMAAAAGRLYGLAGVGR